VSQVVRVERAGAAGVVARVTLARPEARNALDDTLIGALREAFAALATEPPDRLRAVVLAGEGRTFCAGADVGWMRAAAARSKAANEAEARDLAGLFGEIDACPVPVIARVQGAALGGGVGLCAVADIVVAAADATFGFPEVRLGLVAATIAPFVVRRIGEGQARALFTTGERFDAREAQPIGLVHRIVVDEARLDEAVDDVVTAVLAGGPEAVRDAKALAMEVARSPQDGLTERTARLLAVRRASDEAAEGLEAFSERRPPRWVPPPDTGR
jgi:methylglutaconyl-CoA hydratase